MQISCVNGHEPPMKCNVQPPGPGAPQDLFKDGWLMYIGRSSVELKNLCSLKVQYLWAGLVEWGYLLYQDNLDRQAFAMYIRTNK